MGVSNCKRPVLANWRPDVHAAIKVPATDCANTDPRAPAAPWRRGIALTPTKLTEGNELTAISESFLFYGFGSIIGESCFRDGLVSGIGLTPVTALGDSLWPG